MFVSNTNAQQYTAQIGDTIIVTVRERDWLSGTQDVDANGKITLPDPIGAVKVVGLAAAQITELLTERLRKTIVDPNVFVLISPSSHFTLHVTGEVRTPDSFQVAEGTSLQAAITKAGGFTVLADKKQIKIIRKSATHADVISELIIDFTQFEESALQSSNPLMKAGDVVIVLRLAKSERSVVTVMGAVNRPGDISIEEPLSLIETLIRAGGHSTNADLTRISILRLEEGEYSWKLLNLEDFLTGVNPSDNPLISPGEIIHVPNAQPRQDRVNVVGAVMNTGSYPLYKDERLFDAVFVAGGFAQGAAVDKVTIIRPSNPHPQRIEVNVSNYLSTSDLEYNPLLEAGDTVFIPIQEELQKSVSGVQTAFFESIHVTLVGEVRVPGTYQVAKGSTVLDVLNLAGGPTDQAKLDSVSIVRENIRMEVDLGNVLKFGKFQPLPPLQANDTIIIPSTRGRPSTLRSIFAITRDAASILAIFLLIANRL